MKLLIVSDTHGLQGLLRTLPKADVFIHAGDFMNGGRDYLEIIHFNDWLKSVPVPKERRLICAGNHDVLFDETHVASGIEKAAYAVSGITNGVYLQDESIEIEGVKFYFSPWTPYFMGWGFNVNRGPELARIWKKIPEDTEVLVTHGPSYRMLDKVKIQENFPSLGCEELAEKIKFLPKLRAHIFGHIHGSRGVVKHCETGITYINASFLNEAYKPHPGDGYTLLEI